MPERVTADRGEILHRAGRAHLSPALRDGAPALAGHGEAAGRCGWEPFFRALSARGLAVAFGEDGSARVVPRAGAPAHAAHGEGGLEGARRFLRALRGDFTPPG